MGWTPGIVPVCHSLDGFVAHITIGGHPPLNSENPAGNEDGVLLIQHLVTSEVCQSTVLYIEKGSKVFVTPYHS